MWRTDYIAVSEHGAHSSVCDDANAVVKKNEAMPEEVEVQVAQYRKNSLPETRTLNGKKGILERPCSFPSTQQVDW